MPPSKMKGIGLTNNNTFVIGAFAVIYSHVLLQMVRMSYLPCHGIQCTLVKLLTTMTCA